MHNYRYYIYEVYYNEFMMGVVLCEKYTAVLSYKYGSYLCDLPLLAIRTKSVLQRIFELSKQNQKLIIVKVFIFI